MSQLLIMGCYRKDIVNMPITFSTDFSTDITDKRI